MRMLVYLIVSINLLGSVAQSCLTLWDPVDCFPAPYYPPEFAQIHVYWVSDAILPSHPLSLPFSLFFLPLILPTLRSFPVNWPFASGGKSIGASASASVLPMNIQGWLPLGLTGLISLQTKGLSRIFSSTTIQKHQFFGALPFLSSNTHMCTSLLEIS